MADCSGEVIIHGRIVAGRQADELTLATALGAGHVVSHCPACGHRESADVTWWERSAVDRAASLGALCGRLRCVCGSKRVALEVWPVTPRAVEERRRVYHWRA